MASSVILVQVAEWFIKQRKSKGCITQRTIATRCCSPYEQVLHIISSLWATPNRSVNSHLFRSVIWIAPLHVNILPHRLISEQAKVLEHDAEMLLPVNSQ
jgi:hypothetical protein